VNGDTSPERNLRAEACVIDVGVVLAELLLRVGPVTERLTRVRAAVGLFDVSVQPAGVAHCATNKRCDLRTIVRVPHSDNGSVRHVITASSGEMVSIITSTATTVSTAVNSWLIVYRQRCLDVVDIVGDPAEHFIHALS